jgi:hypothetical protein
MNKDLSRLSTAEELWLWRMRQPVINWANKHRHGSMTRGEAAKFLGISLERYKNLEAGRRINVAAEELPSLAFLRVPRPELSLREQLILARRRSGLYIRQIAEEYGLSHTRMLTHEEIAHRRLIDYWSGKGFTGWNMPQEAIPRPAPPPPPPPRPTLIRREARPAQEPAPTAPAQPALVPVTAAPRPRPTLIRRGVIIPPPPPQRPARPQLLRRAAS